MQPALLIETVKRPGDGVINEYKTLLESALSLSVDSRIRFFTDDGRKVPVNSSSSARADGGSLQMFEAHVYPFPLSNEVSLMSEVVCEGEPAVSPGLGYCSELDAAEWRKAPFERFHPGSLVLARAPYLCEKYARMFPSLCVGAWGPLYPRTGFSFHPSDLAASALTAVRAVNISFDKSILSHVVLLQLTFAPNLKDDRMQLVSPVKGQCIGIGEEPRQWEGGKYSKEGKYAWIYWRKKECCASLP
jgi:hypothetical protein